MAGGVLIIAGVFLVNGSAGPAAAGRGRGGHRAPRRAARRLRRRWRRIRGSDGCDPVRTEPLDRQYLVHVLPGRHRARLPHRPADLRSRTSPPPGRRRRHEAAAPAPCRWVCSRRAGCCCSTTGSRPPTASGSSALAGDDGRRRPEPRPPGRRRGRRHRLGHQADLRAPSTLDALAPSPRTTSARPRRRLTATTPMCSRWRHPTEQQVHSPARVRGAVPGAGFEPARPFGQWLLRPPCLPVPSSGPEPSERTGRPQTRTAPSRARRACLRSTPPA